MAAAKKAVVPTNLGISMLGHIFEKVSENVD
jgi:hypothetical protein